MHLYVCKCKRRCFSPPCLFSVHFILYHWIQLEHGHRLRPVSVWEDLGAARAQGGSKGVCKDGTASHFFA